MSPLRRAEIFGALASLVMHGALLGYLAWRTSAPDLGFEFELPMEIELGMSEAVTTTAGSTPAPAEPPSEPSAGREGPGGALDAGVPLADAGPPDAGRRRRRDAGPPAIAQGDDEGEGTGDEGEGQGAEGERRGVAFLPAGAQIALRLDVARVRASPLANDVRQVLGAMPDWQALLEGSGIEPLDDMDRLLVASPNLDRSRLVAAGRAAGGEESIRAAAERLAAASGAALEWRRIRGVPVADWHDQDPTPRVVALIGPRHFVIAREEDVPRVIAVARARAQGDAADQAREEQREGAEGEAPEPRVTEHPADALVSMEEGEGLSLEVEGFRNFARARPGTRSPLDVLPVRLRVGLSQLADGNIGARITGRFDDADQAAAAAAHWEAMREAYARNVAVQFLGIGALLSRLSLGSEEDELRASVDIEVGEMRRLLTLVRGFFEDRARTRRPAPTSLPEPAPPTPLPPLPG